MKAEDQRTLPSQINFHQLARAKEAEARPLQHCFPIAGILKLNHVIGL